MAAPSAAAQQVADEKSEPAGRGCVHLSAQPSLRLPLTAGLLRAELIVVLLHVRLLCREVLWLTFDPLCVRERKAAGQGEALPDLVFVDRSGHGNDGVAEESSERVEHAKVSMRDLCVRSPRLCLVLLFAAPWPSRIFGRKTSCLSVLRSVSEDVRAAAGPTVRREAACRPQ